MLAVEQSKGVDEKEESEEERLIVDDEKEVAAEEGIAVPVSLAAPLSFFGVSAEAADLTTG